MLINLISWSYYCRYSYNQLIKCYILILAAVRKKFDNIHNCKQETISSIMSWMAQAPTRIQR